MLLRNPTAAPALALLGALASAGACGDHDRTEPGETKPAAAIPEPRRECSETTAKRGAPAPAHQDVFDACMASAREVAQALCAEGLLIDSAPVSDGMSRAECVDRWIDGLPERSCATTTWTSPTDWRRETETWPPYDGLARRCEALAAAPLPDDRFLPSCDAADRYLTCVRARREVDDQTCAERRQRGEVTRTVKGDPIDCHDYARFGSPALLRVTHTEHGSEYREVTERAEANVDHGWHEQCLAALWSTLVACL